ncbi:MAG: segregation/condensation protein A [Candidatus Parcubacteria bacterium]|nr:segregation/condensation protein A [Patescibacteria group bacterium]BCX16175.1 MAG: segregation/condensation protein A [Candidatus Parcubacteria bacterium]
MDFEVKSAEFSGPLEKLLELIESKKLDITRISLAEVTADFLNYVRSLSQQGPKESDENNQTKSQVSPKILADFLVVAAQLILIKSKALIPNLELSQEEEQSIQDLEKRLEIYQKIRPIFLNMKQQWNKQEQSFSREMLLSVNPVFYPSKNISPETLAFSLNSILDSLHSFFIETEKIERQLFSLEDKIKEIFKKISQGISHFSQMITQKPKEEIIVMFLALLHLLRDQILKVSQKITFGEIEIEQLSNSKREERKI